MFTKIDEFLQTWQQESGSTEKVLELLTDRSLGQAVAEGHRTLGRIAWHLVTTIPEMMNRTGLDVSSVAAEARPPATAKEIAKAYRKASDDLQKQIKTKWKDATLRETDDMYGFTWARSTTLRILIDHQIHHRGQMTVLMRQAGLKVPGVCGPSLEEWAAFGAPPPEV